MGNDSVVSQGSVVGDGVVSDGVGGVGGGVVDSVVSNGNGSVVEDGSVGGGNLAQALGVVNLVHGGVAGSESLGDLNVTIVKIFRSYTTNRT